MGASSQNALSESCIEYVIDDRLSAMAVEICARLRNTPVVGGQGKFRDLAKAMFSVNKKKKKTSHESHPLKKN